MDTTIDVLIPIAVEAAGSLEHPARRAAAGRYLSDLLKEGRVQDILAEAIADAKREAHANGLTDVDVDAELAAWRGERRA